MEALLFEFTFLSDQALKDKLFNPSSIENFMKHFNIESYKAWATMELEQEQAVEETEEALEKAKDLLDSTMESAMDKLRSFERKLERMEREKFDEEEAGEDGERKA